MSSNAKTLRIALGAYLALAHAISTREARAEAPLTLDESLVIATASASAPALRAARHDAASAAEDAVRAQRARLPGLTLSARYTRLSSIAERYRSVSLDPTGASPPIVFSQLLDNYNVRAALEINLTDPFLRLAAAAEAAGDVAAARRLEAEATHARVIFDARSAYFLLARAHLGARIAEDGLDAAQEQERLENDRVKAGTSPATRALGFSVAAAAARTRRAIANAEVGAAEAAMRQYLRVEDRERPLLLAPPSDAGDSDRDIPPQRPAPPGEPAAIRALERGREAADAKLREETWALLPRLSVIATGDVSAPSARVIGASTLQTVSTWELGAVLEIPLTQLFGQLSGRASAREGLGAAAARLEEARRALEAQRGGARALREGARSRLAAGRQTLVVARTLAETRRAELAAGLVIPLDVTSAESELLRARGEVADAELDLRLADARLDLLEGRTTQPSARPR